jgi:hypothetical protein
MPFKIRCSMCGRSRKNRSDKLPVIIIDKVTKLIKGYICSICSKKTRTQEWKKQQGVKK